MPEKSSQSMVKWAGIIAVLTAVSKLFGFVREASIAYVFGTGLEANAYFMALGVLGITLVVFQQSIVNAFLPIYGTLRKKEDGLQFVNTFLSALILVLIPVIIIAEAFAPQIISVLAPGYEGRQMQLTITLFRIMFPGVLFIGLSGAAESFLHAHHSFLAPALTGFPYNLMIITGLLIAGNKYGIKGLAVITIIGYISQFLLQIPWAVKQDFSLKAGVNWQHRGLKELKQVLPPIILGSAAGEIKALIDKIFATIVNGVATLNFAVRVRELPLGMIITPLITVIYPELVDATLEENLQRFKHSLIRGLGVVLFLTLPIAAGLIGLSRPIIRLVYERGAFASNSTAATAYVLVFLSFGLPASAALQLINRGFFALKKSKIPMLNTVFMSALNIALNFLLLRPLGVGGLALATSLSSAAGAFLSLYILRRTIGRFNGRVLLIGAWKSLLAAAAMGTAVYYFAARWQAVWQPAGFPGRFTQVGILIALGAGLYLFLAWLMKIESMQTALKIISDARKRLKGKIK